MKTDSELKTEVLSELLWDPHVSEVKETLHNSS